jgi:hypothetical protein
MGFHAHAESLPPLFHSIAISPIEWQFERRIASVQAIVKGDRGR